MRVALRRAGALDAADGVPAVPVGGITVGRPVVIWLVLVRQGITSWRRSSPNPSAESGRAARPPRREDDEHGRRRRPARGDRETASRGLSRRRAQTRRLLRCGALTGPLFVAVTAASALTQPGFDLRRHGISLLSLGDRGWIQVANFVVAGALSVAFGEGVRRLLAGRPDEVGRSLAPPLVFAYGAGLLGTGLFLVDPYLGFPAGAPPEHLPAMSWHGAVHAAGPPVAFFSLIGLCAVFARRYLARAAPVACGLEPRRPGSGSVG